MRYDSALTILALSVALGAQAQQEQQSQQEHYYRYEHDSHRYYPHHSHHDVSTLYGKVTSKENGEAVDFATVYLKGSDTGCATDPHGRYRLHVPEGSYLLVVSAIGYAKVEYPVTLRRDEALKKDIILAPQTMELKEVTVTADGVSRLKRSAFNAVALDASELKNSAKNLSDALQKMPGMKLRETGGVGSDMQIMLDGFSGKHIKVFIDGIPQEGAGTAFSLNNIPVNFAKRIEVYKGVVPVDFGTDAIGGVINIVTDRHKRKWFLDASYSYGSFNTHKSYVHFGQSFRNGLTYEINAFQNYSDNNYHIDNWVEEFNHDNNTSTQDESKTQRVRRFNDAFHNEAVIARIGIADKPWADRLSLSVAYTNFYKEIQNGVYQRIVFGEKHRKGYSIVPTLEYKKQNLLTKGLDLSATANYNHNLTTNVDTAMWKYNWTADRIPRRTAGEQSHQYSEQKNRNWNASLTAAYHIGTVHHFTLNHVFNSFERSGRSLIETNSRLENFDVPTLTGKHITGLSYRLMPSEKWNLSIFGKHYRSHSQGTVQLSDNGSTNRVQRHVRSFGYGAAGTCLPYRDVQLKLSYEKALRLPSSMELFGDGDMEAGTANLKPESSHNLNFNLSYNHRWDLHTLYADGSLIYRRTNDYIVRGLSTIGGSGYGHYENHGLVETKGFNLTLRYSYSSWLSAGGTYNLLDVRDRESNRAEGSGQKSLTYGQRLPNQPYSFANFDITLRCHDLLAAGNTLSVGWDSFYQHQFPLYWENIGDSSTKMRVPRQFAHNLSVNYSICNERYNISIECRNLTDAKLYDNFSLQKAGRAFYGKLRVCIGK